MTGDRTAELEARIAELEAVVAALVDSVAVRDERIAELEGLLGESRRAGKRQAAPFRKKAGPVERPAKPGRKSGPDHGSHGHRMAPLGEPDRIVDARVGACGCGGVVIVERVEDQWQVDLPDLVPSVTRFRVQVGHCADCGARVQGRHPEQTSDALGAAGSQVGPHAKAWAAWLHYTLGLSFAKCSTVLARLGVTVTPGALCAAAQRTGTDLVPVHADLVKRANTAPVIVMDETGWRVGGASAWLWVATSPEVTVYDVADGRGFAQACRLINEDFGGVIARDGWAPYRSYTNATHQTCLAHLLRRCDELLTDLPRWARSTPRIVKDILATALAARDLDADQRAAVAADLAERVELLAERAHPHDENRKLVKHLNTEAGALFTFLTHPDVDATNWRAEQAIRPAVINRKVWGGNRTWTGAATQSRMMSLFRTAHQHRIDAIDYLVTLARAPNPGDIPTLIT